MRTRTVEGKFDPRRTYDNLESCQSGTFKIPGYVAGEQIPDLILIDEIKEPEPVNNVVYLHSPSLSDSQILRARPSLSDSQVLRARPKFTGTESGTYINMPNLAQMQANVASIAPCNFTQSGVYQLVEPDINPHGLQQFIEETKEEKSA